MCNCVCAYYNIKSPYGFKLIDRNHTGFTTVSQNALLQSYVTLEIMLVNHFVHIHP